MKKNFPLAAAFLLSACFAIPTPQPTVTIAAPYVITAEENSYAPKPEDISMKIGGVVLTSSSLVEQTDSAPARVKLNLSGSLPRTCDQLRVEIAYPDEQYRVFVEVYSLTTPNVKCGNVFQQFEAAVLLGVYSAGRYTVWVNKDLVGDFVAY